MWLLFYFGEFIIFLLALLKGDKSFDEANGFHDERYASRPISQLDANAQSVDGASTKQQ